MRQINNGFNLTAVLAFSNVTAGENTYRILWAQRNRCRLNLSRYSAPVGISVKEVLVLLFRHLWLFNVA